MREARQQDGVLGLLPPDNWWHDPQISTAVKVSDSQFTALDAIAKDHSAEIDRLRMETTAAERDLRLMLTADKPASADIVTAGTRVRTSRDQMLDHQLHMLADERALLTHDQWTALQDALRDERPDSRRQRGGYPGGGMGRRGGGGRRPF
jgi:phage tail tape-measure protein